MTDNCKCLLSDYDKWVPTNLQASLSFLVLTLPSPYYSQSFILYRFHSCFPVQALITSYLHYWNCFPTTFPASSTYSLQSITYTADSLIFLKCKPGHKLPQLRNLQWLPVGKEITKYIFSLEFRAWLLSYHNIKIFTTNPWQCPVSPTEILSFRASVLVWPWGWEPEAVFGMLTHTTLTDFLMLLLDGLGRPRSPPLTQTGWRTAQYFQWQGTLWMVISRAGWW